jgi:hypothetical protein
MENIKKDYYPYPTQVKFGQRNDEGEIGDSYGYGIAFKEHIICLCCGYPLDLNDEDVFIWEELDWQDIEDQLRL